METVRLELEEVQRQKTDLRVSGLLGTAQRRKSVTERDHLLAESVSWGSQLLQVRAWVRVREVDSAVWVQAPAGEGGLLQWEGLAQVPAPAPALALVLVLVPGRR
jgi:hypothetical protein